MRFRNPKGNLKLGQAIVEYLLYLVITVSMISLFTTTFRSTILNVWAFFFNQISAACPGCPADPDFKIFLRKNQ